jgi:hypothetical protein
MAGNKVNNYGIGDTNFDELMLTADAQRVGFHQVSLTNYDTTTVPQIAAGSYVEVNGALYSFGSNETILGSPSDGDVYIYLSQQVGTASGATTDSTGYSIGSTVITLASAGTGTIIIGDRVTFAGDTVAYEVTSGDADVSNGGSITIASPGLLTAIPASATAITVSAGAIIATFTNTAPTWSDSKQGWYGTGGSANYRYLNFIMTKATTSYSEKRTYLPDPLKRIDTFDINDFATQSISTNGYVKIGPLYYQWGTVSSPSISSSVTFPVAFGTSALSVTTSGSGAVVSGESSETPLTVNAISTTGFTYDYGNAVAGGNQFWWIAIGY